MPTWDTDALPSTTGINHGNANQRWDSWLQDLDVSGTETHAGTETHTGNETHSGATTYSGTSTYDTIIAGVLNNARFVDGVKYTTIQAAHDALPSGGGTVIDARQGAVSLTTTTTLSKPVRLILGAATYTYTGTGRAFEITGDGITVEGQSWGGVNSPVSTLKMGAAVPLIRLNDVTGTTIRNLRLDGATRGFAAPAIEFGTGTTNHTLLKRVYFANIAERAIYHASGNWDDWIIAMCVLEDVGTASLAAIHLAGTQDSGDFLMNQWEGFLSVGLLGGVNAQRVRMNGDKFHGDLPSNTNVAIEWSGFRSVFTDLQLNFIQGTQNILVHNVNNTWKGIEISDPGSASHGIVLETTSPHENIVSTSTFVGPSTGTAVRIVDGLDNSVYGNYFENWTNGILESGTANRNLIHNNSMNTVTTPVTTVGAATLAYNNGVPTNALTVKRVRANQGTALVAGDFALSAGWGSTASVGSLRGTDQFHELVITSAGTGQGASPTLTLTYKDGTWTTAPVVRVNRQDFASQATVTFTVTTQSATQYVLTFNGTPVAAETFRICVFVGGI